MTLNNPVFYPCFASSRSEVLGTPLFRHLAWLRQHSRSSSCCILSVTPPTPPFLSVARTTMLHGQEQHSRASFVYSGHSLAGHLPEDVFFLFRHLFYRMWKGAELEYLKRCKCFGSLIDSSTSYLMVSSVVGFYSLRVFEALTPRKDDTTMTTVKMELSDRVLGEVGARVMRLLLTCWCVWDPLRFI